MLGGTVHLDFPPDALGNDVEITIRATDEGLPETGVPGTGVELGPEGLTFAKDVRLTISYQPRMVLAGVEVALLRLRTLVDGVSTLVVGSENDSARSRVSGPIRHFSFHYAAPATVSEVLDELDAMLKEAETASEERLDELRKNALADISATYPKANEACIETDILSEKKSLLDNQLFRMSKVIDSLTLDYHDYGLESVCGAILDDATTRIDFEPSGPMSLVAGQQVEVKAIFRYDPADAGSGARMLFGAVGWLSGDKSIATVTQVAGLASMSAIVRAGERAGETAISASSLDFPKLITGTLAVIVEAPDGGRDAGREGGGATADVVTQACPTDCGTRTLCPCTSDCRGCRYECVQLWDRNNCGGCGIQCASDENCLSCAGGEHRCARPDDPNNCGYCGRVCVGNEWCTNACGARYDCIDFDTNPNNCGGCGIQCGSTCSGGRCQ